MALWFCGVPGETLWSSESVIREETVLFPELDIFPMYLGGNCICICISQKVRVPGEALSGPPL